MNRLKELREQSKLTVREVGKLLDIDHTYVTKHENGTRPLTTEVTEKYAQLYKVKTHELFFELPTEESVD